MREHEYVYGIGDDRDRDHWQIDAQPHNKVGGFERLRTVVHSTRPNRHVQQGFRLVHCWRSEVANSETADSIDTVILCHGQTLVTLDTNTGDGYLTWKME